MQLLFRLCDLVAFSFNFTHKFEKRNFILFHDCLIIHDYINTWLHDDIITCILEIQYFLIKQCNLYFFVLSYLFSEVESFHFCWYNLDYNRNTQKSNVQKVDTELSTPPVPQALAPFPLVIPECLVVITLCFNKV